MKVFFVSVMVLLTFNLCALESAIKGIEPCFETISDRLTPSAVVNFVKDHGSVDISSEVKKVLSTGDVSLYSGLAFDLQTGKISSGEHLGQYVFENENDAYIAQFLLAATIITTMHNFYMLRKAFVYMALALTDGGEAIGSLGVDVNALNVEIKRIEEQNPYIYD